MLGSPLKTLVVLLATAAVGLEVAGCTTMAQLNEEHYSQLSGNLNQWIGKHRDERIKAAGPPNRCFILETHEEVCEWIHEGVTGQSYYGVNGGYGASSSWKHSVLFIYDSRRIAKSWRYNGDWGQFQSDQSPAAVKKRIGLVARQ